MSETKNRLGTFVKFLRVVVIIITALILFIVATRTYIIVKARPHAYNLDSIPNAQVALVLGAGLSYDNTPSDPLRDRIDAAIDLYNSGKVQKLLMSGDNRFEYYNEPEAMKQYAISQGISESDIVLDYAGRRTYDSCYRAKAIFGLDQVIVVSQNYHLPRALFLCNSLGLDASGTPADDTHYLRRRYSFWRVREIAASVAALWDVYISHPLPVLGEPEPIFPN